MGIVLNVVVVKIISFLALMLAFNSVYSGAVESTVSFVQVNSGTSWPGLILVKLDSMPTSQPGCATDSQGRLGFFIGSDAGKATFSVLVAAQASGRMVEIYGKNTCIGGTSIEELDFLRIKS